MPKSDWVTPVSRTDKPWGHEELFAHVPGKEPGESIHLRPGVRHRVTALVDSVFLEASTTELDDVVRLEGRYGREGTSTP